MKIYKLAMLLAITLSTHMVTNTAGATEDICVPGAACKATFNTIESVTSTIAALPNCIEYRVLGIELRAIIHVNPPKVEFFSTLRIDHNHPDLLITSEISSTDMPWAEWNIFVNTPLNIIADSSVLAIIKKFLSLNNLVSTETYGGQSRNSKYGAHQDTNFKDSHVVGNPGELVMMFLEGNGSFTMPNPDFSMGGKITGKLPSKSVINQIIPQTVVDTLKKSEALMNFKNMIHDAIGKISMDNGPLRIDRYFCPSPIVVAQPYFHSWFDALLYREGMPINDFHKMLSMMNPLSDDAGGPLRHNNELWGYTYPRSGFYNHDVDYKGGLLVINRANAITGSDASHGYQNLHVRLDPTGGREKAWQSIHPTPLPSCHLKFTNIMSTNNAFGNYGAVNWRSYQCSLAPAGKLIAYIAFPSPGIELTKAIGQ